MPLSALMFDADGRDTTLNPATPLPRPGERQLLWLDVQGEGGESLAKLLDRLNVGGEPIDPEMRAALLPSPGGPAVHHHDRFVALCVQGLERETHRYRTASVHIAAGGNVLVTAHEGPVTFLAAFRKQLEADTALGGLDASAFLAVLLGHHIEGFAAQLAPLEDAVDRLDERILADAQDGRRHLESLVALRRRISDLRRLLGAHRTVYAALAGPDFVMSLDQRSEALLTRLQQQFEHAQEAVALTREQVLASFDLLMSSTGQRTNEVMRVLTVVTVTLGIIAAVAGLMGMNFQADIFKAGNTGFRDVMVGSFALIVAVMALGRWQRWL